MTQRPLDKGERGPQRRTFLQAGLYAAATSLAGRAVRAAEPPHDVTFVEDFDELWSTLAQRYCFFSDKQTDWNRVRALYRPMAVRAASTDDFADIVRRVLAELYDAHTHLSQPSDGMPRWPLYDLMASRQADRIRIEAVAEDSAASAAGLRAGDVIAAIDGRPAGQVMRDLMPRCLRGPDRNADTYVANVAVAGRVGLGRTLLLERQGEEPRPVSLPVRKTAARPDVEWRRLAGNIGYIAIRGFGDEKVVRDFDDALMALRDTGGLVIDVRYDGGGDTAIARPIMGRFIDTPKPYAMMRRRDGSHLGPSWTETVEPRGPFTYSRPIIVLTNHWSASMAEGFPMGMRDIGRAVVVGTPMMGLGAAVFPICLDRTGIQAQYSAEPVYDTTGRPRWKMQPDICVPEGGDILDAGLRALHASQGNVPSNPLNEKL
ncbi:S41 family peptidase [Novacetimonas pomaceti]|uniref:S41 family peptidase n=1 Tax=Novacetimonas pomaceti TaxID=2021998 RepID=UPI001EF1598B|nr:S41 family peptidase [Novacetimonas pomaceti]